MAGTNISSFFRGNQKTFKANYKDNLSLFRCLDDLDGCFIVRIYLSIQIDRFKAKYYK